MRPQIIIASKRIIALVLAFLVVSSLLTITRALALNRWKAEMWQPGLAGKTVVIDPGHGGADPGATKKEIKESALNMELATALKQQLEQKGVKVKLTREGEQGLVPRSRMTYLQRWLILEQRKDFALQQRAHLLISIHVNSNKDPHTSGGMVFYADEISRGLAQSIQKHLNTLGLRKRQVERGNFTIIRGNPMPSVLIESGFMTNKHDLWLLTAQKDRVVTAICAGMEEYAAKVKPPNLGGTTPDD